MVIVEQFSAELEIKLVVEPCHPFEDLSGLLPNVLFVVEADDRVHE